MNCKLRRWEQIQSTAESQRKQERTWLPGSSLLWGKSTPNKESECTECHTLSQKGRFVFPEAFHEHGNVSIVCGRAATPFY